MTVGLTAIRWLILGLNVVETVGAFALSAGFVILYFKLRQNAAMLRDVCDDLDALVKRANATPTLRRPDPRRDLW